jgi:hypothetical protein
MAEYDLSKTNVSATRSSKACLKVSYITQCVFLKLILKFLYIGLHVSTDIDHHQVFKKLLVKTAVLPFCGSDV